LLIDAISDSNITSNDGIMHSKFEWMLKDAVVARFKTASNVTGYKERLQALQFERPKLLQCQMLLTYMTEGSNETRGTCTEGAQMWQFNMRTHLANCSRLEVRGVT
jgi:hypothetical protein